MSLAETHLVVDSVGQSQLLYNLVPGTIPVRISCMRVESWWCGSEQWWSLSCDAGAGIGQTQAGAPAKTRTRNKADMTVRLGQPGFKSLTLLPIRSPAWRGEKRRFHKI